MKKRIFCLLLVLCIVSSLFLGCRKAPTDPDATTLASAEQETTDAAPTVNAGFSEDGPQYPSQETTEGAQSTDPSEGSGLSGTPEQTAPADSSGETTEPNAPSFSPDTPTSEQTEPEEAPADTTAPEAPEAPESLSYEAYLALDAYGKQAYFLSFPDWDSFFSWQENAIEEYEKTHSSVDADGTITLPVAP